MSWLFSRALVEEYSGENSLDGAQYAPLNGSRIQQAYCAPDKMTGFSRLSQFGMTFKPLMEDHGKALLTSYLGAFPAKTSQQRGGGQELMAKGQECGEKWRGSFVKYSHGTHLWKTHQCSLLGDLDEFSETWPQWGLMRDGECWEQQTLAQTIRGTEFGLLQQTWPTPKVQDSRHAKMRHLNKSDDHWKSNLGELVSAEVNGGNLNPTWVEWLMGWPLGWTDLKPLETDKSHCVQQPLGES
jgi:hypothetical protein